MAEESSSLSVLTLALAKKWSKAYTDQEVGKILSFDIEIVETLPQDPSNHTIYLVPKTLAQPENGYFEYIYINNKQELIGDTEIDLSDYYKKGEVDQLLQDTKEEIVDDLIQPIEQDDISNLFNN